MVEPLVPVLPGHPAPRPRRKGRSAPQPLPARPRPRSRGRGRQLLVGLGLTAAGASILAGLMGIPQRFDGVLLVSKAIADLISGLSRLGYGLLQLAAVLVVALLALLALLLLCGGLLRIVRALFAPPLSRAASPASSRPAATTTRGRRAGSATEARQVAGVRGQPSGNRGISRD